MIAVMLCMLPLSLLAESKAIRFLGIPVDGPKSEMIEKIKAKGFTYHITEDYFTGYYYGYPVYVFVQLENRVVNRIIVYDIPQCNQKEIKKRFNELCTKFDRDKRYRSLSDSIVKIRQNEDILKEMRLHQKQYRGLYAQGRTTRADSLAIQEALRKTDSPVSIETKYKTESLRESRRRIHVKAMKRVTPICDGVNKSVVWFAISEKFKKFGMILVYDNLNNFSGC